MRRRTLCRLLSIVAVMATVVLGQIGSSAQAADGVTPGSFIVDLVDGPNTSRTASAIADRFGGRVAHVYDDILGGFAFRGPDAAAAGMARDPRVVAVYPDHTGSVLHHRKVARQELYSVKAVQEWHIDAANPRYEGSSAVIAVLDAGVEVSNRNLGNGNNIPGERGDNVRRSESCIDNNSRGAADSHGTEVVGTAVGGMGVLPRGAVYHVEISAGALFDLFADSNLLCGFEKVKERLNAGMKIGAINLSYYITGDSPPLQQAIRELRQAGVLTVVAAGNNGGGAQYPARYPESVAVSALDTSNSRFASSFSSRGAEIDMAAPGENVTTTGGKVSGTSFAAPHVAAAVALLKTVHPELSPDELVARLQRTGICPDGSANADAGNCNGAARPGDPDGLTEPALNVEGAIRG